MVCRQSCQRGTEGVGLVVDTDGSDDSHTDPGAGHDFDVGDVVLFVGVGSVGVGGGLGGGGDIDSAIVRFGLGCSDGGLVHGVGYRHAVVVVRDGN